MIAGSASEAMQVIAEARESVGRVDLLLLDLHMSGDPEENGPALLARLSRVGVDIPPTVIVSGTLADPVRAHIAKATGFPLIAKDAFFPARGENAPLRVATLGRVRGLLTEGGNQRVNLSALNDYIVRNAQRLTEVSNNRVFVDEVKARVASLAKEHGEFSSGLKVGIGRFLVEPDINDDSGVKLHEFKNQLVNLSKELSRTGEAPEALLAAIASLQFGLIVF